MKRTRTQQPKAQEQPQDPAAVADAGNAKPQRRAKQPRQPKGAKKPAARGEDGAAATSTAAPTTVEAAAPVASPGPETAPTVPDVCGAWEAAAMDWDLLDAGFGGGAAWWTWGVDEDKLLGWFPYVDEDFRCRAGDAEVAFDDDIWRIHQIYEIPSYAAK